MIEDASDVAMGERAGGDRRDDMRVIRGYSIAFRADGAAPSGSWTIRRGPADGDHDSLTESSDTMEADNTGPEGGTETLASDADPASDFARLVDLPAEADAAEGGLSSLGHVDGATAERITGWAHDPDLPGAPIALEIFDNDEPIARVLADQHRPDLETAGIGGGLHGFAFRFPGGLSSDQRHVISVRRETDGKELEGSPIVIEAAESFGRGLRENVARAVAAISSPEERDGVLAFLVGQVDALLQKNAEAAGTSVHLGWLGRWGRDGAAAQDDQRSGLFIADAVPGDGASAASQVLRAHMRALRDHGFAVSFVAAGDLARRSPASDVLESHGIVCCHAPFYASVEEVLRRARRPFDIVYLHGWEAASRYAELVRALMPRARIIYGVGALAHERLRRAEAGALDGAARREARRVRLGELSAAFLADAVLARSTVDASLIRRAVPEVLLHVLPLDERASSRIFLSVVDEAREVES